MSTPSRIYWANAMFSMADRAFNARCTEVLRREGYRVFLPQENAINEPSPDESPTADAIFRIDTSAILGADVLVACLDQETIDCGVACEIGIAYAYGIPIVALYTDIRQYRRGPSRMYKNPYVVGAIEALGKIVSRIGDLPRAVEECLSKLAPDALLPDGIALQHFDSIADSYSEFVERLESWYAPHWKVEPVISQWLDSLRPGRVIEYGCGTGRLGTHINSRHSAVSYLGHDESSDMIRAARTRCNGAGTQFTSLWADVEGEARKQPFDMAWAVFALHDHIAPQAIVARLADCLRPGGVVLVIDLATWDLPRLTHVLRIGLARPSRTSDNRLDSVKIARLAEASEMQVLSFEVVTLAVDFPSAGDVGEYLRVFGVLRGMDLPLGLDDTRALQYQPLATSILEDQPYPFSDHRAFVVCALRKP